jgi:YD repeat-containing protein
VRQTLDTQDKPWATAFSWRGTSQERSAGHLGRRTHQRSKETRQAYDERDALVGKLLQKYKAELPLSVIANFERRMLEKTFPKPKRKRRLRNKPSMTQTDFASVDPLRITDFEFFIPLELHILLSDKEGELESIELPADGQSSTSADIGERSESAALEEAVLDLARLDRYQRRAWSRQKAAIRDFRRIKSFRGHPAAGSSVSQH